MKLISVLAADGELLSKLTGSYWEYIKTSVLPNTNTLSENTQEKITGPYICQ